MSKLGRVASWVVASIFVFAIASGINEASAKGGQEAEAEAEEAEAEVSELAVVVGILEAPASVEWAVEPFAAEWVIFRGVD